MIVTPDIAYLGAARTERLDLYRPKAIRPGDCRAAVVIIHGGGWGSGDKADARETGMAKTLIEAGYVCASINYQLSTPGHPSWPTCLHDCRAAVRHLRAHARQYGIATERIGAIGGSAGGCMALLLGAGEQSPADGRLRARVRAVVALYPPTDLPSWGDCLELFGFSKATHCELHQAGSPLYQLTADFPPTLLIHGTADTIVPPAQSERLAQAMERLGIRHELMLIDGAGHSFPLQHNEIDLRQKVVDFFDQTLPARP
ncbi:MAG TPA: alpha/beta hydrolase [Tepidisphaeraceae bacterium]|jgi:acetyl esterase/lipase